MTHIMQLMTPLNWKNLKFFTIFACFLGVSIHALANEPAVVGEDAVILPNYFDINEKIPIPDVKDVNRLRFVTSVDFPPFSFLDQNGRLAGFHVDLAREICRELKILNRCQIQGVAWPDIEKALDENKADAAIAGLAVTQEARKKFNFSRSYLELPARFVARQDTELDMSNIHTTTRTIGVLDKSAHQAMLKAWFPDVKSRSFASQTDLYKALKDDKISVIFTDSLQASFWLASVEANNCCDFKGGPYISPFFLGQGLAIAVQSGEHEMVKLMNFALANVNRSGRFQELYLRYFPKNLY